MKRFVCCSLVLLAVSGPLFASSATWNINPINNDWNTAANWTPAIVPNDPSDTATFDLSNITTVSQAAVIDVGEIIFNPGASAFTISVPGTLNLDGTGITNNSGMVQNFVAPGLGASIIFYNSATAGEDTVFTQGPGPSADVTKIAFYGNSSAGSATFINHGNAQLGSGTQFYENSTAANATIFNLSGGPAPNTGGDTMFFNAATAGSGTLFADGGILGEGMIYFDGSSSADHASITINGATATNGFRPAGLEFADHANAANATVVANGGTAYNAIGAFITFDGNASAGNARFIVNGGTNGGRGATLYFYNNAPGGAAQLELFYNGTLDLGYHSQDTPCKLGSISGNGLVELYNTNFIVGSNNFTTSFAGLIGKGNDFGFGSLTKIGSGSFALLAPNTYQGGTVVQGTGYLFVNNLTGSGTGTGAVQVNSGGLAGNGIISGAVVIGDGSGSPARFKPGGNVRSPGVLTIGQSLTFNADASYAWLLDPAGAIASSVVTPSVTIASAALFAPAALQSGTLPAGTIFTVINNSGTAPIAGRFANLPDGGTVTVGTNTFQANYEGGDGNDLTLTVVP